MEKNTNYTSQVNTLIKDAWREILKDSFKLISFLKSKNYFTHSNPCVCMHFAFLCFYVFMFFYYTNKQATLCLFEGSFLFPTINRCMVCQCKITLIIIIRCVHSI